MQMFQSFGEIAHRALYFLASAYHSTLPFLYIYIVFIIHEKKSDDYEILVRITAMRIY